MKNYFKILFMFVLVFIGFSNVSAEDNLKCVYKQDSAETKVSIENLNGNLSIDLLSDGEHTSISSDALSNISLANFQDLENNKWICDESLFVKYEGVSQGCVISKVFSSDSSDENRFKFNLITSESEYGFPITIVDSETGEIEDLTTCDYGEIKFQFNSTNFLSSFNSYDGINESIYTIRNVKFDQTDLTEGTCPKVLYRLYMNPTISSTANMDLSVSYYLDEPSVSVGNISDSISFDGKETNNIPVNVENTEDSDLVKFEINEGNKITCGDTELPLGLVIFSSNIFTIIKLLVPIILIISGSITLAKAVVSSDEKVGKESTQSFIRRIIGAIILFMVFQLTQIGLSIGDGVDNKLDSCVNLLINGTDEDNSTSSNNGKFEVSTEVDFEHDGYLCGATANSTLSGIDLSDPVGVGSIIECQKDSNRMYKCQRFICVKMATSAYDDCVDEAHDDCDEIYDSSAADLCLEPKLAICNELKACYDEVDEACSQYSESGDAYSSCTKSGYADCN